MQYQQQSPTQSEFERDLAECCPEVPKGRDDLSIGSAREVGEEESRQREATSIIIGGGEA